MRNRRIRDIIIDLTSLLDVVMILIFAVMIQNAKLVKASSDELAAVKEENAAISEELSGLEGISEELADALAKIEESRVDELIERLQFAENRLDSYEYMDDIIIVFNIGFENRYYNTKSERFLTYGRASGGYDDIFCVKVKEKRKEDFEWAYAVNSLKMDLGEFLSEEMADKNDDKYIYIIFTVNKSKVYSDDFADIEKVLKEAELKYETGRVRYKIRTLD